MGAKDHSATLQLFDLLEARFALRLVWALGDGHPQTFRLLQDSVGGATPNTLNTRLKQLRAAHLVKHDRQGYRLTNQGLELARRLGELPPFASRWAQQEDRTAPAAGAKPETPVSEPGSSPPSGAAPRDHALPG